MGETPKDPLAEHPLGPEPSRSTGPARTLNLFPDVSQAPLASRRGGSDAPGARGSSPEAPAPAPSAAPARERAPGPAPDPDGELGGPEDGEAAARGGSESGPVAFARRVAAGLADLVILGLFGAVELAGGALLLDLRFPLQALVWLGALLLLAALVLLVLVPFVWGTTPGMALADLRILADDGGGPTLAAAFLRFVGFLLTGFLAGVPLLVAAFDRRGRTPADLLSSTTLVPAR